MGETQIVRTFLFESRGMLMVKLPAHSTAADDIGFGDEVELSVTSDVTVRMRHSAVEVALPATGPPCDVLLGLTAAGPLDLDQIGRLIAGYPGAKIVLRWRF